MKANHPQDTLSGIFSGLSFRHSASKRDKADVIDLTQEERDLADQAFAFGMSSPRDLAAGFQKPARLSKPVAWTHPDRNRGARQPRKSELEPRRPVRDTQERCNEDHQERREFAVSRRVRLHFGTRTDRREETPQRQPRQPLPRQ